MTANILINAVAEISPSSFRKRLYLVGGAVREHLLGKEPRDADLLADLSPNDMLSLGFRLVNGRSTAPIFFRNLPGVGNIEVTLLAGLEITEELRRRDFRCNSIAMGFDGSIHDPFNGQADILHRSLVPTSLNCLKDDPLRIFRAFRFESEGWICSPELVSLFSDTLINEAMKSIPVERFTREMMKALSAKEPSKFFRRMLDHGTGQHWLPELFSMQSVPAGPSKYHPEPNLLEHSIQTLEQMTTLQTNPIPRLAALLHDVGKLDTPEEMWPRHHGHDRSGEKSVRSICKRLALSAKAEQACAAACGLHLLAGRWGELRPGTRLTLAEKALRLGICDWLPDLVQADRQDDNPMPGWVDVVKVAGATATELGISKERRNYSGHSTQHACVH